MQIPSTSDTHTQKNKQTHSVDGKYKCGKCSKEFSHQAGVARHAAKIDCMKKKIEHKCRVCSKIFLYKSELERHQSFHEKSESQQCTKCKKYFRRKDFFTKHMQTVLTKVKK